VSATDYIINAILVLLVLQQIRENRLDLASLVLPVVLVGAAAAYYLHSVTSAGNDIALDLTLAAAGAILGVACALSTRMRRGPDGVVLARAEVIARTATLRVRALRLPAAQVSPRVRASAAS
jgi:hypothetical protein